MEGDEVFDIWTDDVAVRPPVPGHRSMYRGPQSSSSSSSSASLSAASSSSSSSGLLTVHHSPGLASLPAGAVPMVTWGLPLPLRPFPQCQSGSSVAVGTPEASSSFVSAFSSMSSISASPANGSKSKKGKRSRENKFGIVTPRATLELRLRKRSSEVTKELNDMKHTEVAKQDEFGLQLAAICAAVHREHGTETSVSPALPLLDVGQQCLKNLEEDQENKARLKEKEQKRALAQEKNRKKAETARLAKRRREIRKAVHGPPRIDRATSLPVQNFRSDGLRHVLLLAETGCEMGVHDMRWVEQLLLGSSGTQPRPDYTEIHDQARQYRLGGVFLESDVRYQQLTKHKTLVLDRLNQAHHQCQNMLNQLNMRFSRRQRQKLIPVWLGLRRMKDGTVKPMNWREAELRVFRLLEFHKFTDVTPSLEPRESKKESRPIPDPPAPNAFWYCARVFDEMRGLRHCNLEVDFVFRAKDGTIVLLDVREKHHYLPMARHTSRVGQSPVQNLKEVIEHDRRRRRFCTIDILEHANWSNSRFVVLPFTEFPRLEAILLSLLDNSNPELQLAEPPVTFHNPAAHTPMDKCPLETHLKRPDHSGVLFKPAAPEQVAEDASGYHRGIRPHLDRAPMQGLTGCGFDESVSDSDDDFTLLDSSAVTFAHFAGTCSPAILGDFAQAALSDYSIRTIHKHCQSLLSVWSAIVAMASHLQNVDFGSRPTLRALQAEVLSNYRESLYMLQPLLCAALADERQALA